MPNENNLLINTCEFERWKMKRKQSFITFCALACCLGTEYSIIIPSLWFYLKDVMKTKNLKILYGATLSGYYVSGILGSFLITRFIDKYRNIRLFMLTLLLCEIFGNVLYSIPMSPYFPLFGRLIQGLGDINMSVMIAEVARSFSESEVTGKISVLVACFSTTFVIAPAINVVFKYVDVEVGGFRVNYGNLPGIFMALLFTVVAIVIYFKTSNVSKEFDLKEHSTLFSQHNENITFTSETTSLLIANNTKTVSCIQPTRSLLCFWDFNLLVTLGFILSFSVVAFLDVAMPILASKYYNFTSQGTGILFFVAALVFITVLLGVKKLSRTYSEYHLILIGLAVFLTSTLMLLSVSLVKNTNYYLGMALLIGYVILLGMCWCIEQVLVRSLLCKLIPSSKQTFAEGVRRSASSFACILSSFITPLVIDQIGILCCVVILSTAVMFVLLHTRRRTLKSPRLLM